MPSKKRQLNIDYGKGRIERFSRTRQHVEPACHTDEEQDGFVLDLAEDVITYILSYVHQDLLLQRMYGYISKSWLAAHHCMTLYQQISFAGDTGASGVRLKNLPFAPPPMLDAIQHGARVVTLFTHALDNPRSDIMGFIGSNNLGFPNVQDIFIAYSEHLPTKEGVMMVTLHCLACYRLRTHIG
jgi:hypothetical protein